ncbi:alpha/beta fold hydrolase [Chloroflexota bacterium]
MDIFGGYTTINGARLYYEITGSGSPLVLIHGFSLDTRMWDDQFDAFAQHYRVIRYDMRGFGKSDLPTDESYSHADDLKALMDSLGVTKAHMLGFSMGGGTATEFAISYPENTNSLIAVDALASGYDWQSQELGKSFAAVLAKAKEENIQAAKEFWLTQPLFSTAHKKPQVAARLHDIISNYSGWHFVNSNYGRALDPPVTRQLEKITAPTQIIVGSHDLPELHAVADLLSQGISGASKVILPGVGHLSNMESPVRFNKAVLAFLAGI